MYYVFIMKTVENKTGDALPDIIRWRTRVEFRDRNRNTFRVFRIISVRIIFEPSNTCTVLNFVR